LEISSWFYTLGNYLYQGKSVLTASVNVLDVTWQPCIVLS